MIVARKTRITINSGPFAPLSGDVYRVQTITEGRLLDDFTFNPDDSLRAPNNGAYYTVTVTERD